MFVVRAMRTSRRQVRLICDTVHLALNFVWRSGLKPFLLGVQPRPVSTIVSSGATNMVIMNQWLPHSIALVCCPDLEHKRASVFPSGATIDIFFISIGLVDCGPQRRLVHEKHHRLSIVLKKCRPTESC
jgi:hypothetical protein